LLYTVVEHYYVHVSLNWGGGMPCLCLQRTSLYVEMNTVTKEEPPLQSKVAWRGSK
jgi:hypothetical protein